MKFGGFYEHQLPRPWTRDSEHKLFQNALDQAELADRVGYDYIWATEHHFLEEYAHSSAPEVFLAACSQRTKNARIGHGIVHGPPNINHPARVAERIATLDLVSNGRCDYGFGAGATETELGGFRVPQEEKKQMMLEGARQTIEMMVQEPYAGYEGKYFSMPSRNVLPKPVQQPHPPLWMACSNRTSIQQAATLGVARAHEPVALGLRRALHQLRDHGPGPLWSTSTYDVDPDPSRVDQQAHFRVLRISPGHWAVHYVLTQAGSVRLQVFDIMGRAMLRPSESWRTSGPHEEALEVEGLRPGAYLCRLTTPDRVVYTLAMELP
mgnify:CR=1 FL=1